MNIEPYRQILTKYWGFTSFKPLQEDIIRSVAEGKDTLGTYANRRRQINYIPGTGTGTGRNLSGNHSPDCSDERSG